ncbi:12272_t:CDS:2, partial [Acaulospora morrowiae]
SDHEKVLLSCSFVIKFSVVAFMLLLELFSWAEEMSLVEHLTGKEKIKEIKRLTELWNDINVYTDGSLDPTDDNNVKM